MDKDRIVRAQRDAGLERSGWERRLMSLRPQSYDVGIAISIAVGIAATYTLF